MLDKFKSGVLDKHPETVVIEAGFNDLLLPSPTTDSISQMAEAAAASGARVLISSIIETEVPSLGMSAAEITAFDDQLVALCRSYGYGYINYRLAMQSADGTQNASLFLSDEVHPTAEGYHIMWKVLQPLL